MVPEVKYTFFSHTDTPCITQKLNLLVFDKPAKGHTAGTVIILSPDTSGTAFT